MKTTRDSERYHRQKMLLEIGTQGQEKLLRSKIVIIGAGGLGSAAAVYLAAAGVGSMGLVDNDIVDQSNLNRQILHRPKTVGKTKVDSAREMLTDFNPDISIISHQLHCVSVNQVEDLIKNYEIVLDCTDNFDTRHIINQACVNKKKPLIYGAISEFEGQIMTIIPGKTPCYTCLYPSIQRASNTIAAVIGVTSGIIGTLQATEALKYLLGIGELLSGRLLFIDLLDMHIEIMKVTKNKQCPICGICQ
jgi:adenylyltransferase/sulfurtransferase